MFVTKSIKGGKFHFTSKHVLINKKQRLENILENFKIPPRNRKNKIEVVGRGGGRELNPV